MTALFRILCLALTLAGGVAQAEQRLALVIGNSAYGTVSPLDNPSNDARLIGDTLAQLGFEVTLLIDANLVEMKRGIARFGRQLRDAGSDATGLFYYAGHGVQSYGANYLLPVDVALADAADLDLVALEAQTVLRQMFSARNRTNIVILDACRNNPFTSIPEFNDNGLAEMKAPTGTFLAYATAPGGVALDGFEANSPFTHALAAQLTVPGQPIEQMFKQVRIEVLKETGGRQTPWDSSSLTSDFMFAQSSEPVMSARDMEELQIWQSVQAAADPLQLMLFLRGYPDSKYANEARRLLTAVMGSELAASGSAAVRPTPLDGPSQAEKMMLEAAQADASIAGYEAYLQSYPDGVYGEFARQEIAAMKGNSGTDPHVGEDATTAAMPAPDPALPAKVAETGPVTLASPLVSDLPEVSGRTIAQLIQGSPLYPPVEGLPESYWKGQTCSNCHQWNPERLCQQANTYLSLNAQRSLDKQHPYGGVFKRNLKSWAAGGCQ